MKRLLLAILAVSVLSGALFAKDSFHRQDRPATMKKYKIERAYDHKHYYKGVRYHQKQIQHNEREIAKLLAEVRSLKQANKRHYRAINKKQQHRDNFLSKHLTNYSNKYKNYP